MESLILENASFVEKMKILLFENAWKGAWWAKKQFFQWLLENGPFVEKTNILPFENARECTSGRHVGAFAWVNMHQIMRDVLRGAFLESLILENGLFVEKTKI